MSIVGRSSIREAVPFFERGLRATESVVLLSSLTSSGGLHAAATGWFVTPRLILTMSYALEAEHSSENAVFEVAWNPRAGSPVVSARARVVWRGEGARPPVLEGGELGASSLDVALLQLEGEPASSGFLKLNLKRLELPDDVYVLQYNGAAPLMQSSGEVFHEKDSLVFYDADTQPGAGGAPLFNEAWEVMGVHVGSSRAPIPGRTEHSNFGLTLSWVIEQLRVAPQWQEISAQHRLLGPEMFVSFSAEPVRAPRVAAGDVAKGPLTGSKVTETEASVRTRVHRAAAVRWSFAPDDLHPAARRLLAMEVSDPDAPRWTLRSEARGRVLRSASVEELRAARGTTPVESTEQQVIDRILQGPPFRLDEAPEAELSCWLPAVRWFSGVVSGLPSVQAIALELETRRLRGRLQRLVGPRFEGRTRELERLEHWRSSGQGPFVVRGLGGVGKSALVARFILKSPAPFVWFDFDSAELAPDDAPTLLAELLRQLRVQLPPLQGETLELEDWRQGVDALGGVLSRHGVKQLVLVLDSFESAQYEGRHAELWPFMETLSAKLPGLRVLVSGRVPLPHLTIGGVAAEELHLSALDEASARSWLKREGIRERSVVETVLSVTRRLPLNLRLAIELVKGGDPLADLSKTLPEQLIQGYLYRRILRRVSTESLRRLARGALVLRRLTADMVYPVLGKACSLDERKAREDFTGLAGELALVEGTTVLRHRADVRNAVLNLLEAEDAGWVRSIEEAAVRWYAAQDVRNPDIATELVYHRLRLGDLRGAEQAWVPGVAARMGGFALDEIPEPGRGWLAPRLHATTLTEMPLEEWERDASDRIRDAIERKLWRAVPGILKERAERSAHSPLVFLEAYTDWKRDKPERAQRLLRSAGPASGPAGRARAVLQACIAEEAGKKAEASKLLEPLSHQAAWADRRDSVLERMAVLAARVRLLVDLDAERHFVALCVSAPSVRRLLAEADLVQPDVQALLEWPETGLNFKVESFLGSLSRAQFERVQSRYLSSAAPECQAVHRVVDSAVAGPEGRLADVESLGMLEEVRFAILAADRGGVIKPGELSTEALSTVLGLVGRATLRWRLMREAPFLPFLDGLAAGDPRFNTDPELTPSLLAQAAPFSSPGLILLGRRGPVHDTISQWLLKHGFPGGKDMARVRRLFDHIEGHVLPPLGTRTDVEVAEILIRGFRKAYKPHWILAALHLAAPSPLPRLVERLVERPD